jgi:hypothetical protein
LAGPPAHASAGGVTGGVIAGSRRRAPHMADVAYVALTIGIFALLALMLRGLEKLQ